MPDDAELLQAMTDCRGSHLALARRFVGNDADAADVVQDSYTRAWRSFGRFRGEANVRTWLHSIVANTARTCLARRRRLVPLDDLPDVRDAKPAGDPDHCAEMATLRREVEAALAQLPESLRSVVELKDIAGYSHREVGLRLGISETAAKVRLHRARRQLRLLLQDDLASERAA